MRAIVCSVAVAACLFLRSGSTAAADLEDLLPPEADVVVSIIFEQLLDGPLARKHLPEIVKRFGFDHFKEMARQNDTIAKAFQENEDNIRKVLADPRDTLKWVDAYRSSFKRATVAIKSGSGDGEPELAVFEGNWDARLLDGMFTIASITAPEDLKVIKSGDRKYYQTIPKDGPRPFAALLGNEVAVITVAEDALIRAMDVHDGKKVLRKANKKLRDLVRNIDPGAAVTVCLVDDVRKLTATASLTVARDITLKVVVVADTEDGAKEVQGMVEDARRSAKAQAEQNAALAPALRPLLKPIDDVLVTRQEREVTVEGRLTADVVNTVMAKLLAE